MKCSFAKTCLFFCTWLFVGAAHAEAHQVYKCVYRPHTDDAPRQEFQFDAVRGGQQWLYFADGYAYAHIDADDWVALKVDVGDGGAFNGSTQVRVKGFAPILYSGISLVDRNIHAITHFASVQCVLHRR